MSHQDAIYYAFCKILDNAMRGKKWFYKTGAYDYYHPDTPESNKVTENMHEMFFGEWRAFEEAAKIMIRQVSLTNNKELLKTLGYLWGRYWHDSQKLKENARIRKPKLALNLGAWGGLTRAAGPWYNVPRLYARRWGAEIKPLPACIYQKGRLIFMRIINLTPHTVTFFVDGDIRIDVPPSGQVARVAVTKEKVDEIQVGEFTMPVFKNTFGEVENMPAPQEGTIFIVSAIVAQALKGKRNDVFIVDDTVRDEHGRIIGARALAVI